MTDVTIIWRDDADKYTFVYTTSLGGYSYYPQDSSEYYSTVCSLMAIYNTMSRKNIKASFALDNPKATGYPIRWAKETTGGTAVDYYNISGTTEAYDFIYETAKRVKNDVEENDEDEVKSRTYVSSLNLQNIVLNEPLKLSISDDACDTDKDGLTDCREVDSAKGLMTYDPDMRPVLPTYEECINCVLLDEDAKAIMLELKNKLGEYGYGQVKNMIVLPLKSDPTKEDSDDDGLLDGTVTYVGLKKVAPKDPHPLLPDGPDGIWERHIYESSDEYTIPNTLGDWADFSVDISDLLENGMHSKIAVALSNLLMFRYDENGTVLHSQTQNDIEGLLNDNDIRMLLYKYLLSDFVNNLGEFVFDDGNDYSSETWQKATGYNWVYDAVFKTATNDNMKHYELEFNMDDGKQYILWIWRGDYLNLGAGAEIGLYTNPHSFEIPQTGIKIDKVQQWDAMVGNVWPQLGQPANGRSVIQHGSSLSLSLPAEKIRKQSGAFLR